MTRTFNLSNETYYLLLAFGNLKGSGDLAYHSAYTASAGPVDLGSFGSVATAGHTLIQGVFFDWSPQKSLSIEILYENT